MCFILYFAFCPLYPSLIGHINNSKIPFMFYMIMLHLLYNNRKHFKSIKIFYGTTTWNAKCLPRSRKKNLSSCQYSKVKGPNLASTLSQIGRKKSQNRIYYSPYDFDQQISPACMWSKYVLYENLDFQCHRQHGQ